jgi:hypothetical protein
MLSGALSLSRYSGRSERIGRLARERAGVRVIAGAKPFAVLKSPSP